MRNNRKSNKKKKALWLIVALLFLLLAIGGAIILWKLVFAANPDFTPYKTDDTGVVTSETSTENAANGTDTAPDVTAGPEKLPAVVDFAALQAENPDVYAWITVPGTKIDYPIVQHPTDPEYYLRRDYLGKHDVRGCIFTQCYNRTDFTDPNTVIYGHYMSNKTFFGGLHEFRDAKFFNEHQEFYIYTPGHKFTYQIFAAYEYDARHILYAFDFSNEEVFAEYLDSCLHPMTVAKNVREGVELTTENRIVTLSTCVQSGADNQRYLVQGVFINDEPTE